MTPITKLNALVSLREAFVPQALHRAEHLTLENFEVVIEVTATEIDMMVFSCTQHIANPTKIPSPFGHGNNLHLPKTTQALYHAQHEAIHLLEKAKEKKLLPKTVWVIEGYKALIEECLYHFNAITEIAKHPVNSPTTKAFYAKDVCEEFNSGLKTSDIWLEYQLSTTKKAELI